MGFQDSWWNISVSSLMILDASVFGISYWKNRQTDRETDRQTNADETHTPATAVGLGNNISRHCWTLVPLSMYTPRHYRWQQALQVIVIGSVYVDCAGACCWACCRRSTADDAISFRVSLWQSLSAWTSLLSFFFFLFVISASYLVNY